MSKLLKRFTEWIGLKEKLDLQQSKPPFFKEGEIWWCAIGENVGVEVSGKESGFSRPVLVFKKLSQYGFLGLPMTTQEKTGTWYVHVVQQNKKAIINLSQARFFSSLRMYNKLSALDDNDFQKTKKAFTDLFCI